jgi:hypothetical protein
MTRQAGYLASLFNVPPLIFRFQFNPEMVQEKRSFGYEPTNSFGQWGFTQAGAALSAGGSALSVAAGLVTGAYQDLKGMGPLLLATKPLQPKAEGGEPREIELEFRLDATYPGPLDGSDHYGGSILPDLAILRSFVNPAWGLTDMITMIGAKQWTCPPSPPPCTFKYAGLSIDCVMESLEIKHTEFGEDRNPIRAEVSCTLKEQSQSLSPLIETFERVGYAARGLVRPGALTDVAAVSPVIGAFF